MISVKVWQVPAAGAGREYRTFTLSAEGCPLSATLCDYGARWISAPFVFSDGTSRDMVLGYSDPANYVPRDYFGAVVGRFANRIGGSRFSLDGAEYVLNANDGRNHLHGGMAGFDCKIWNAECCDGPEPSVTFSALSPDGDENYPGNLIVSLRYTLLCTGALRLDYTACSDRATVLNISNHAYFNLAGEGRVDSHVMRIDADRYLPTDAELIPTGEIRPVDGTVFDFRIPKPVSEASCSGDADIAAAGGIDHCFVFSEGSGFGPRISVVSPDGRVRMGVFTNQPCVQVYTGNFLADDGVPFRNGPKTFRGAICLETQKMPDSPNHVGFTDCVLRPGSVFRSRTEYLFKEIDKRR
jgi:aldose 1-epimerase